MKTKTFKILLIVIIPALLVASILIVPQKVSAQTTDIPWPMAGGNPQRTSWTPANVDLNIATQWVKPIAPYVSQNVQTIGAEGKVFVSTAGGLYAFDANTGADVWKYPTDLPLGHSATYNNGVLYVGGLDKKIHAVRASDGQAIWTFTAEGGFSTSPVVADSKVFMGSRDGWFYAVNVSNGTLAWKFQTGNQILQSAAYKDGVLYFASNDGYAYALNSQTGSMVWQSDSDPTTPVKDKFPSYGFYSWWPVIYGDDVIFTRTGFYSSNGQEAYFLFCPIGTTCTSIPQYVVPGTVSTETQSGYWPVGEKIFDLRTNPYGDTFINYFEQYPYRRNAFFVNRTTGLERRFDLDSDGIPDYAPISWVGDNGIHDPPVVVNGVLYFHTLNKSRNLSFSGTSVSGWKVGTPFMSLSASYIRSSDEPTGISASGTKIYYNHCCDRGVGAIDVSIPNSTFPSTDSNRERGYFGAGGLPIYQWDNTVALPSKQNSYYFKEASKFFWDPQSGSIPSVPAWDPTVPCCAAVFWNENDKVGPAAYNGKLYVILGNALVAFGPGGTGSNAPVLSSAPFGAPPSTQPTLTDTQLKTKLELEVSEMVAAGHLKPSIGRDFGHWTRFYEDSLGYYWHNPADLQRVLIRALPYLNSTLQGQVKTYLKNEYALFPINTYSNIGFLTGTQRDPYPYPPYISRIFEAPNVGPGQGFPPQNVYAMWQYEKAGLCVSPCTPATMVTQAQGIIRTTIPTSFTDAYLAAFPHAHNAWISGYIGYIELAKLAGQTPTQYAAYQTELDRLLVLRKTNLKTFPNTQQNFSICDIECYFESLINYHNFAYMTPELGNYLFTNARSSDPNCDSSDVAQFLNCKDILKIIKKHQDIAPYWMEAHNAETQGEYAIQPYPQTYAIFQALSLIKHASREELLKYLDTPIVPIGDLYYIDNLVAVLQAGNGTTTTPPPPPPSPTCTPKTGDLDNSGKVSILDLTALLGYMGTSNAAGDLNCDGADNMLDIQILISNFGR